jgi:ABC-type uncharacterized transport system substrate-binding protein
MADGNTDRLTAYAAELIMFNPDNAAMPGQLRAIAEAASALGLQITEAHVRDGAGIERAINGLALEGFPADLNRWDSQEVRSERFFAH